MVVLLVGKLQTARIRLGEGNPPTVFSAGYGEALRMPSILAKRGYGGKERLS
jgi:hypothetical protein